MKVLELVSMLSDMPMRVNRRSTGLSAANSAGTKQPTCRRRGLGRAAPRQAQSWRIDARQTGERGVPLHLCQHDDQRNLAQVRRLARHVGPGEQRQARAHCRRTSVRLTTRRQGMARAACGRPHAPLRYVSLGVKVMPGCACSSSGWRPATMASGPALLRRGRTYLPQRRGLWRSRTGGRQRLGVGSLWPREAHLTSMLATAVANAASMSSSAMLSTTRCSMSMCCAAAATAPSST